MAVCLVGGRKQRLKPWFPQFLKGSLTFGLWSLAISLLSVKSLKNQLSWFFSFPLLNKLPKCQAPVENSKNSDTRNRCCKREFKAHRTNASVSLNGVHEQQTPANAMGLGGKRKLYRKKTLPSQYMEEPGWNSPALSMKSFCTMRLLLAFFKGIL